MGTTIIKRSKRIYNNRKKLNKIRLKLNVKKSGYMGVIMIINLRVIKKL